MFNLPTVQIKVVLNTTASVHHILPSWEEIRWNNLPLHGYHQVGDLFPGWASVLFVLFGHLTDLLSLRLVGAVGARSNVPVMK